MNNLELAQILSTINLVIVAEEFFGITDYRFKTPALYSLFEYPHPNHGCFSKALVYRFPASVTYEAAPETGVAHLHKTRAAKCAEIANQDATLGKATADDISLNDEAPTEAVLLWSRRDWLARRDICSCGRHSPCRFRHSSSFLGSIRPDDPRSKQRVSPFKRLQDRFIVVVWGIKIHCPEAYRAKVEKTRSNYFKKSDAPIDACDVLRMESLIVHESIVISDQFAASRRDNAKVFPRHCEEPSGRPMTGSATRQSTLPGDLPSREPTACRRLRRLKFQAVRPADRCIVEFDLPLVIIKGTKKRRNTRMKFVSYGEFGQERAGFLRASQIVDLEKAMIARALQNPVSDMRLFLERVRWKDELAALEKAHGDDQVFEIASVRLGAPVPVPRKLLIAGANTFSHLKEAAPLLGDISPPIDPMILGKATSSIAGPFDDMVLPPETTKLDYEVEVGIVIGKKCRRISKQQVKDHVAGFVTVNEASARDIQLASKEKNPFYRVHFVGKSFDTFCPMGPALVTVDEFEWGKPLKMRTLVNGKIRQDSDTSDLCHGFERLVSFISEAMTLFPGDVIASGSPAGVGNFMEPTGFLKVGDVVRCEVDGIGAIENRVVG